MLTEHELYQARRAAALETEVILSDCGVRNIVKWPELPSAEIDAKQPEMAVATNDALTTFVSLTGQMSLTKRDVMLCRADGYDITPGWFNRRNDG